MLISQLAGKTGASPRALRHYESRGLLTSARQSNRYRHFPETAVEQVRRIRMLLDAGLNLDTVAELLPCFATDGILGACPTAQRRLSAQIRALDERINGLTATRETLATALHKIDPTQADNPPHARCDWTA